MKYADFIDQKTQHAPEDGFKPLSIPGFLFDFQQALVEWAVRKGRAAIFADCGLGKTPMQLVWADNVVRKTNKPVLLLTPLAVSGQTLREAEKFQIEAQRADPTDVNSPKIHVTNYERLHHFTPDDFAGVVCDESSILKAWDGETRKAVTAFVRKAPYRLLCTATAAPNDYTEIGTSSEALGYLGHMDMLSRFFVNNRNNSALNGMGKYDSAPQWRFRGHAEHPFWRWVCSWARSLRKPSDLGFDDARFQLPGIEERVHVVSAIKRREGLLFALPAVGLQEERAERRKTIHERCDRAASIVADTGAPAVLWAHLNDEADLLEKILGDECVQVSGRDSDEEKEAKFEAFGTGKVRLLVTKPIIGAWGLNWQHCAHMTTFSGHSFEQYYQSVRRFYRFGQKRTVVVDHVISDGEDRVLRNLHRKAEQAERMFTSITAHMREEMAVSRAARVATKTEEIPSWL